MLTEQQPEAGLIGVVLRKNTTDNEYDRCSLKIKVLQLRVN